MAQQFSISFDNRGKMGQAVDFNPDNDNNGLWIEGSDFPGGESGGIFMNGNVICLWSPGDNDLLRVLDEDSFPTGTPVFRIANDGAMVAIPCMSIPGRPTAFSRSSVLMVPGPD